MALRVGKPPSAGAWVFFERAFQAASKDPQRFNPPDPFEESRRLETPQGNWQYELKFKLCITAVWFSIALLVYIIGAIVDAGWGEWLVLALVLAVTGTALYFTLRTSYRLKKKRALSAGSVKALSPLVKQAQRGTFNGLGAYPYARTYAEATYRRQQLGLDLENALPFEVQICHDIAVHPGSGSLVTRARENELRAVQPIIFSGLDFSTEIKQERNRFLGSLLELAEKDKSLPVGEIISTRGGVVVADIKWWNGTLSMTPQGTFVDYSLGLEELSRHRSIYALSQAARSVNGGDIEFVLVIVAGGTVRGGKQVTTMNKQRVVVAEWTEAMGELIHLDAKKTVVPPASIAEILDRTPQPESAR